MTAVEFENKAEKFGTTHATVAMLLEMFPVRAGDNEDKAVKEWLIQNHQDDIARVVAECWKEIWKYQGELTNSDMAKIFSEKLLAELSSWKDKPAFVQETIVGLINELEKAS